jgi:hypothetical protein
MNIHSLLHIPLFFYLNSDPVFYHLATPFESQSDMVSKLHITHCWYETQSIENVAWAKGCKGYVKGLLRRNCKRKSHACFIEVQYLLSVSSNYRITLQITVKWANYARPLQFNFAYQNKQYETMRVGGACCNLVVFLPECGCPAFPFSVERV